MRCARTGPPVRAAPGTRPTHGTDERQLAQIQDVMFPSKKLLSCPENRSLVAQYVNISKAGQAVGLESSTANRYATLLEAAFMIQRLPAWGTTLGKRIAAYPKVHVIDSGLAGWLLGLSAAKISSRDPAVLTEFGHLVETFAVEEILKQVSWSEEVATAAYFRTQNGDEVDLVLETWDGRVVGFEVKAGSRVQDADLSGLRLLRDRLGERFMAGFLLNLGELAYRKEERVMVVPLSGLWSLALSKNSVPDGMWDGPRRPGVQVEAGRAYHSSASIAKSSSLLHSPLNSSLLTRRASWRMPSRLASRTDASLRSSIRATMRCRPSPSKPSRSITCAASVA